MSHSASIDSVAKANRYLSGLGGRLGFDEALKRIEARSSPEVGGKLRSLGGWVRGQSATPPEPELALIGQVVRHAPSGTDIGPAIGAAELALADARSLADFVRSGMSGGLAYSAALLAVAGIVSLVWLSTIAPQFADLYEGFGVGLPGLTRFLAGHPWILFLGIAGLAVCLVLLVLGQRHLARRIESVAPLGDGLVGRVLGGRLRRLHDQWRALALGRAWTAGGADPLASVGQALAGLSIAGDTSAALSAEIELAKELGEAGGELEFQSLAGLAAYRDAIETWRAVGVRLLQAAIAVLVGVIVAAVYLPLFQMGGII